MPAGALLGAMSEYASNEGLAALAEWAGRLDFYAWLNDTDRLLKVQTALPELALIPERLVMREALSQPFELVLDALSTSAHFELKRLLGEQITVSLKQADGSYRPWHGYVAEAAQLGSDGGLARYRLLMRPWLSWLGLRLDTFVYQDLTSLDIAQDIFRDYAIANVAVEVSEPAALRRRSLCIQYRESDLAFVQRLLAEDGLSWFFRHLSDEDARAADAAGQARHQLVITDAGSTLDALGPVRFTAQHSTAFLPGLEDPITAFSAERRLTPNAVVLGSWDYRQLAGSSASQSSALNLGEVPTLELYDGAGAYRYQDAAGADRAAQLALQAVELGAKRFEGQGGVRRLRPGQQFELIDHALYGANASALLSGEIDYAGGLLPSHRRDDNAFSVLAVEHRAANNLGSEAAELLKTPQLAKGSYRNHFHAVPAAAPLVPRRKRKPTAPALLTARVVGLAGEPLTSDRDHRVKVQFHFQRGQQPNPGGLAHVSDADPSGNAPGDEHSGTWVRVGGPAAGANWGSLYTPRIGTEVAVQFIEGDIDRPLIAGALHREDQPPPFGAGVDSGVNHPGVLSGLASQHLDGGGSHQWVMDDATGQLRTRLASSYASGELHLGHLIQQGAGSAQRGSWRGSGFEAGTQGWSSWRAARGLLVSTQQRAGTYGSAESTQMDMAESVAQLQAARDLGQRLSDAASAIQAAPLKSHADGHSVPELIKALDVHQDGKHPGQVNGQVAAIPDDGRTPGSQPVPAFAKPAIVLDTPAAQAQATPASLVHLAGQDLSLIAQGDWHASVAHTYTQVAGRTSSLYAHEGGLQIKAAHAPVSLRAHTDELKILADQSVTLTSVNAEIHISANSRIELVAGQSGITLEGGDITVTTPGAFSVKGGNHAFLGGGSQAAVLTTLPDTRVKLFEKAFVLLDETTGLPIVGLPYRIRRADGTFESGETDTDGATHTVLTVEPEELAVEVGID
jgi:type VI secretion system secreted protein VgrG